MLALLDEVPGVAESRVDWTGQLFLLSLERATHADAVAARANEILGGDARRLDDARSTEALSAYRRGEKWMRSGETLELSRVEAGVLARSAAAEAMSAANLDEAQRAQLERILEREIAAAFERIHAEGQGLPPRLDDVFGDVRTRTLEQSRDFLTAEQVRAIEEHFADVADG